MVFGQKNKNQHFICSQTKSSSRAFNATSSLTDDQSKIDIAYYRIDFEIDFNNEQIFGSVLANGFIGMDQPEFLEFAYRFAEASGTNIWEKYENLQFDKIKPGKY